MTNLETARRAIVAAEAATASTYLAVMGMGAQPDDGVRAALEAAYVAACHDWTAANAAWMTALDAAT